MAEGVTNISLNVNLIPGTLQLQSGDALVVKIPNDWTIEQIDEIRDYIRLQIAQVYPGVKMIFIPEGSDIQVVKDV